MYAPSPAFPRGGGGRDALPNVKTLKNDEEIQLTNLAPLGAVQPACLRPASRVAGAHGRGLRGGEDALQVWPGRRPVDQRCENRLPHRLPRRRQVVHDLRHLRRTRGEGWPWL